MTATAPVRTVQTERQFMNWRHYPSAVNKPAARIFGYSLAASFGLFESVALFTLWSLEATARDAAYWYAIAAMMSLAVGGFAGWYSFATLHSDYLDMGGRQESTTQTDHAVLSEQARALTVNQREGAILLNRPAKTLNGVTFQGRWLEKLYTSYQDGNTKFTREAGGISGSAYGDCYRVLQQGGYIDDAAEWTAAGVTWLSTK